MKHEKIKVLRIIDRTNIGGPAKHVAWLSAELDKDNFETVLLTGTVPPGEGDMGYFVRAAGVEPVVIPEMSRDLGAGDVLVFFKVLRWLWRIKPDIVHTHKAKAGAVGRVAAMVYRWLTPSIVWLRPRRCRIVHTYHGHVFHSYFSPRKTRIVLAIERALATLCTDVIVTISEQQRREIGDKFRVGRPGQLRVIPLGIDWNEGTDARSSLRKDFGIGAEETVIGIVGRLCEVKNHALFLQAAACLMRQRPDFASRVRFAIVGDGHLRAELEERARQLGIADRVVFAGFRSDAMALYEDLDVVALTSNNEGTPLTLIEAMSKARPVVTTQVGGVVDIMGLREREEDGFTIWEHGLTTPVENPQLFADALSYLMDRPELRARMGERAQNFVHAHLSKARLLSDVEELYHELMGTREPQTAKALPSPVS